MSVDAGRELVGVAPGVPLGVEDVLPARLILEPERGVTLGLRAPLTGDGESRFGVELWSRLGVGALRVRSGEEAGERASRGATYGFTLATAGIAGFTAGCPRGARWVLSGGMSDVARPEREMTLIGEATILTWR